MKIRSSRIRGFHAASHRERLGIVAEFANLAPEAVARFGDTGNLPFALADRLVENVIGTMNVPLGIATNMIVDGRDLLVPMATEESSVIAAVCNAAKQCRDSGGFVTSTTGSRMIGQIQLVDMPDPQLARHKILERRNAIKRLCDEQDPVLVELGGGFVDLEVRVLETAAGAMVISHLIVDTRDAMGANVVNTMAEALAPKIAEWTGGRVYLRILSNLADRRLARAHAVWPLEAIATTQTSGEAVRDGIVSASHFAAADPYRAATHNKGIMNGVTAVALATGNDTRAIEAGAHAYAARAGRYTSLSRWEATAGGDLAGTLELPLAVGTVGGATKLHPTARLCLDIMGVGSAEELQRVIVAVGLAQNFAALKALATLGVQHGHMRLHAQNVAMMAGAVGEEIDAVAEAMTARGAVRHDVAAAELARLRGGGRRR
ncbi:MAG: hydroxymethylglutaryl-CoA reductase, degradative [Kiloniellaceae bacterium]